jgi:glycosyltransferase involved in cell wall biosynthesis
VSRALIANDNRFIPYGDKVLSEGQFAADFWTPYLQAFEEIVVVGRRGVVPNDKRPEDLNVSSRPGVSFEFVPNLADPIAQVSKRREALGIISDALSRCDAAVARLPSEAGLLTARAAEKVGRLWAADVAGCPWDGLWNYGTWQGKVYAPIQAHRMRSALRRAPFAMYVTQRFLQSRYPCPGYAVACSDVQIEPPEPTVMKGRLARISSSATQTFTLGLIGSLHGRTKGIHVAMKALSRIRREIPRVRFRILGPGIREPWESLAKEIGIDDLVSFDGVLPSGPKVWAWLDDVDLYLQPSFKEGLPRALVEAMSRGCPALASNVAGIPELLDPNALHRPGNVGRLADQILLALDDFNWRTAQAKRNWERARAYTREILEPRRLGFWSKFAAEAQRFNLQKEADR